MHRYLLFTILSISISCSNIERSEITISNYTYSDCKTLIQAEGIINDSIIHFRNSESFFIHDTCYIEFTNNNGWQARKIHIKIFDENINGWECYSDDISTYCIKIKNLHLNNLVNLLTSGEIKGHINMVNHRENGTKITYKGDFCVIIKKLTQNDWTTKFTKPNGEYLYK
jgi:hypothetical protein